MKSEIKAFYGKHAPYPTSFWCIVRHTKFYIALNSQSPSDRQGKIRWWVVQVEEPIAAAMRTASS